MRTARPDTVDAYIASHPPRVRTILRRVRGVIRKALPSAEEIISYQIPAYRLHGTNVVYFAAWKDHYSVYPAGAGLTAGLNAQLARYKVSKGTLRFPLSEPVPATLIARIAKALAQQAAERAAAKRARKAGTGAPSS